MSETSEVIVVQPASLPKADPLKETPDNGPGGEPKKPEEEMFSLQESVRQLKEENKRLQEENKRLKIDNDQLTKTNEIERLRIDLLMSEVSQAEEAKLQDPLTGLLNRRALMILSDSIEGRAYRSGNEVTALYFDLDNFKAVNDNVGHSVGDRLLVEVSESLRRKIRSHDTLFRMGGDEILAILEEIETKNLKQPVEDVQTTEKPGVDIKERIEENLKQNIQKKKEELIQELRQGKIEIPASSDINKAITAIENFGVSVGSTVKNEFESVEDLIKRAESEMYVNKQQKKIQRV